MSEDQDAPKHTKAAENFRFWAGPVLQMVLLALSGGIAIGTYRQVTSEAKAVAEHVQADMKLVSEAQTALATRVVLLETHRTVTDEKLNQIGASLKDIDAVTRSLHDNVLILCQMSSSRDRCKN